MKQAPCKHQFYREETHSDYDVRTQQAVRVTTRIPLGYCVQCGALAPRQTKEKQRRAK